MTTALSSIPSVDEVLACEALIELTAGRNRDYVVAQVRRAIDTVRVELRAGIGPEYVGGDKEGRQVLIDLVVLRVRHVLAQGDVSSLRPAVNATGVILHTGLGRAPLALEALEAVQVAAERYCNLELNLETGDRGSRGTHVEDLLVELTGAEAVAVANNNAGAVMLMLNSLARGREVIPVIEVKHASYFAECGHDMAALLDTELASTGWKGRRVVIESFELTILRRLRERGTHAELVFLLEAGGIPADQLTDPTSRSYTEWMTPEGLDVLAAHVDGISPDKTVILAPDAEGRATGPAPVVARAHERGLAVFTWTCRPENAFLLPPFRTGDLADYGDWRSEWAVLARAGLDGVFVDHADLGVEVFGTEPIGEGG